MKVCKTNQKDKEKEEISEILEDDYEYNPDDLDEGEELVLEKILTSSDKEKEEVKPKKVKKFFSKLKNTVSLYLLEFLEVYDFKELTKVNKKIKNLVINYFDLSEETKANIIQNYFLKTTNYFNTYWNLEQVSECNYDYFQIIKTISKIIYDNIINFNRFPNSLKDYNVVDPISRILLYYCVYGTYEYNKSLKKPEDLNPDNTKSLENYFNFTLDYSGLKMYLDLYGFKVQNNNTMNVKINNEKYVSVKINSCLSNNISDIDDKEVDEILNLPNKESEPNNFQLIIPNQEKIQTNKSKQIEKEDLKKKLIKLNRCRTPDFKALIYNHLSILGIRNPQPIILKQITFLIENDNFQFYHKYLKLKLLFPRCLESFSVVFDNNEVLAYPSFFNKVSDDLKNSKCELQVIKFKYNQTFCSSSRIEETHEHYQSLYSSIQNFIYFYKDQLKSLDLMICIKNIPNILFSSEESKNLLPNLKSFVFNLSSIPTKDKNVDTYIEKLAKCNNLLKIKIINYDYNLKSKLEKFGFYADFTNCKFLSKKTWTKTIDFQDNTKSSVINLNSVENQSNNNNSEVLKKVAAKTIQTSKRAPISNAKISKHIIPTNQYSDEMYEILRVFNSIKTGIKISEISRYELKSKQHFFYLIMGINNFLKNNHIKDENFEVSINDFSLGKSDISQRLDYIITVSLLANFKLKIKFNNYDEKEGKPIIIAFNITKNLKFIITIPKPAKSNNFLIQNLKSLTTDDLSFISMFLLFDLQKLNKIKKNINNIDSYTKIDSTIIKTSNSRVFEFFHEYEKGMKSRALNESLSNVKLTGRKIETEVKKEIRIASAKVRESNSLNVNKSSNVSKFNEKSIETTKLNQIPSKMRLTKQIDLHKHITQTQSNKDLTKISNENKLNKSLNKESISNKSKSIIPTNKSTNESKLSNPSPYSNKYKVKKEIENPLNSSIQNSNISKNKERPFSSQLNKIINNNADKLKSNLVKFNLNNEKSINNSIEPNKFSKIENKKENKESTITNNNTKFKNKINLENKEEKEEIVESNKEESVKPDLVKLFSNNSEISKFNKNHTSDSKMKIFIDHYFKNRRLPIKEISLLISININSINQIFLKLQELNQKFDIEEFNIRISFESKFFFEIRNNAVEIRDDFINFIEKKNFNDVIKLINSLSSYFSSIKFVSQNLENEKASIEFINIMRKIILSCQKPVAINFNNLRIETINKIFLDEEMEAPSIINKDGNKVNKEIKIINKFGNKSTRETKLEEKPKNIVKKSVNYLLEVVKNTKGIIKIRARNNFVKDKELCQLILCPELRYLSIDSIDNNYGYGMILQNNYTYNGLNKKISINNSGFYWQNIVEIVEKINPNSIELKLKNIIKAEFDSESLLAIAKGAVEENNENLIREFSIKQLEAISKLKEVKIDSLQVSSTISITNEVKPFFLIDKNQLIIENNTLANDDLIFPSHLRVFELENQRVNFNHLKNIKIEEEESTEDKEIEDFRDVYFDYTRNTLILENILTKCDISKINYLKIKNPDYILHREIFKMFSNKYDFKTIEIEMTDIRYFIDFFRLSHYLKECICKEMKLRIDFYINSKMYDFLLDFSEKYFNHYNKEGLKILKTAKDKAKKTNEKEDKECNKWLNEFKNNNSLPNVFSKKINEIKVWFKGTYLENEWKLMKKLMMNLIPFSKLKFS